MLLGSTIKISPSWLSGVVISLDFTWDDTTLSDPRPSGEWAGELALLAGAGTDIGEWEWDPMAQELELWVHIPGGQGARRLVAVLEKFPLPPATGNTGTGQLAAGLVPTTQLPKFGWETINSSSFDISQSA